MQELTYLDFDVLLERAEEGTYRARVFNAPAGQTAPVTFRLPLSPLEIENFLLRVGRPRHGTARRVDQPETAAIKAFGGQLFDALFRDDLHDGMLRSVSEASHQGSGLRIRLRLADCPELAELPWEFLYDRQRNRFLSLSHHTPLIRYLELPDPPRPLAVDVPLRVLTMIASPNGYLRLDVEQEWSKLHEALGDLEQAGRVRLERLESATLSALQRRLRRGEYHIFHFIGHGGFDPQRQDGVLVCEDGTGQEHRVSGEELGALLNDHGPMRLVVLNACEGARSGTTDPFSGTAQSLVQQGLPAVIAMQFEITDQAAIIFSHELYAAVADGYPLDAALTEARKAIRYRGNLIEWATPVLYMRAPNGRIFNLASAPATSAHRDAPAQPTPVTPPQPQEPPPRLRLSDAEIDFGTLYRGAVPALRTVLLHDAGGRPLHARASTEEPWINLHQVGDKVQIGIDTAVAGRLDGEVHVRSDGGDSSIRVRAVVGPGPVLSVEPRTIDFGPVDLRARPEVLVRVSNTGRGELRWAHRSSGSFFQTERVPEGLRLRLHADAPGRYRGSVSVRSNGGDITRDVQAEVTAARPSSGMAAQGVAARGPGAGSQGTGSPAARGPGAESPSAESPGARGVGVGSQDGQDPGAESPGVGSPGVGSPGARGMSARGPGTGGLGAEGLGAEGLGTGSLGTGGLSTEGPGPVVAGPGQPRPLPSRPRRRGPSPAVLVTALALLLVGGVALWGLVDSKPTAAKPPASTSTVPTPSAPTPPPPTPPAPKPPAPGRLEDLIADYGAEFTLHRPSGPYTLDTLGAFSGADAHRLRPILEELGFGRGYARALKSADDEVLSVNVMELASSQAARKAAPQVGVCRDHPQGDFDLDPPIAGATGRSCIDAKGRPVQEVVFTRGPRLYRVKLEKIKDPESTARIVELAHVQAERAR